MGVMSCCRKDCENIMCSTYIDGIGYLCYECEREFQDEMEDKQLNERQWKEELNKFTDTSARYRGQSNDPLSASEFLNKYKRE